MSWIGGADVQILSREAGARPVSASPPRAPRRRRGNEGKDANAETPGAAVPSEEGEARARGPPKDDQLWSSGADRLFFGRRPPPTPATSRSGCGLLVEEREKRSALDPWPQEGGPTLPALPWRVPWELRPTPQPPPPEVWLHVYHLGPIARFFNSCGLRDRGLGAFHCGVEVLGIEWDFQGVEGLKAGDTSTGVTAREPRSHPRHVYFQPLSLGRSRLTRGEIGRILRGLITTWPASSYHFARCNCVDFSEGLVQQLQVPTSFPAWVHGCVKDPFLASMGCSVGGCAAGSLGGRSHSSLGVTKDPLPECFEGL